MHYYFSILLHIILITFSRSACYPSFLTNMNTLILILLILMLLLDAAAAWIIRKHVRLIAELQTKVEQLESKVGQIESEIPGEVNELFTIVGKIDQFLVSQFLMPMAANQLSDKEWPAEIVIEDNVYPVSDYLVGATLKFDDKSYEITEVYNKNVRLKKI